MKEFVISFGELEGNLCLQTIMLFISSYTRLIVYIANIDLLPGFHTETNSFSTGASGKKPANYSNIFILFI